MSPAAEYSWPAGASPGPAPSLSCSSTVSPDASTLPNTPAEQGYYAYDAGGVQTGGESLSPISSLFPEQNPTVGEYGGGRGQEERYGGVVSDGLSPAPASDMSLFGATPISDLPFSPRQ